MKNVLVAFVDGIAKHTTIALIAFAFFAGVLSGMVVMGILCGPRERR